MKTIVITLALLCATICRAQMFRHPGLVVTDASLSRMKTYIAEHREPVYTTFLTLKGNKLADADYQLAGPYRTIARDGAHRTTKGGSERDFGAAFYNALLYRLTGVVTHKEKSLAIINAYSEKLQSIDGHDAPLCCLQGYYLVNAMELMRDEVSVERRHDWIKMLRRSFVPVIDRFEAMSPYANGNWGAIVNKMRMAVAIFTDDRAMYNKAKQFFANTNDNAALPYYIGDTGQCQETGRDQGHAQLGIGNEAEICEMAWSQGDDLWGLLDNRMLKGYEYTARYNLGYDVPFVTWQDRTGLYDEWQVPGAMGRGKFMNIYELAYAHFAGRKQMQMPYTAMVLGAAGMARPEAGIGNCDVIGPATLLFYNGVEADRTSKAPKLPAYTKLHQVFVSSAPHGAPLKSDYDVYLQPRGSQTWIKVDTYMAKVNALDSLNKLTGHSVSEISYCFFDFTGNVTVKVVTKNRKYRNARIRPDYRGTIANMMNDSTLQFLLFQPENLSIEFDGDIRHNLLLFTSSPGKSVAEARKDARKQKRNFIYYKPGYYEVDTIRCKSNTTYYLENGAYINGTFAMDHVENVSILGRGVARPIKGYEGAHIYRSKNVLIDGLIVNTCPIGESRDVTLSNVKSISHVQWGDGLNIFGGCTNIRYHRIFCRNSDDCHTVYATRKGFKGGVKNVTMTNAILWADVAHPIHIGLHSSGQHTDSIESLTYRNIDILGQAENQIEYQGCLAINCGDNNIVKNVTFDNIRIENIVNGSLFHLKVCYNDKYGLAPGGGISDIFFRCIRYYGLPAPRMSVITGYAPDRMIKNVSFEDIRLNGKRIADDMIDKPKWYHTTDYLPCYVGPYVDGLHFK